MASAQNPGKILIEKGDVGTAMKRAAKTFTADFKNDYVCHAQMEPLNAVVQVAADLQSAEVWVGSQQGPDTKLGVPTVLGIPPEKVNVHLQYLGGGFGRRSMNDFVEECTLLAREVAPRPLKLIWTREDDFTFSGGIPRIVGTPSLVSGPCWLPTHTSALWRSAATCTTALSGSIWAWQT